MTQQKVTGKEFLAVMVARLDLPREFLAGSERLEDLEWDSLKALEFMALADVKLGIRVSADGLAECETVSDLLALCGSRLAV